ncbi:carbohydrate sulfotransferase 11-like [Ptychodera flava]|uniref:carbohydrate sulfotransferase 11-like n=1 Tax=Ptychodera flava TaxID=63121 RepID=UPI00396A7592
MPDVSLQWCCFCSVAGFSILPNVTGDRGSGGKRHKMVHTPCLHNRRWNMVCVTKHRLLVVLTAFLAVACISVLRQTGSDVPTKLEEPERPWHGVMIRSIMRSITRSKDRYRQRLERIDEVCDSDISDDVTKSNFHHAIGRILVDPARKVMYCEVEKAASTNVLRVFDILDGQYKPNSISFSANPRKRQAYAYRKLSQYNKTERAQLMEEDYTKFMFVRHPFSRLISCFVDKVVDNPDDNFLSVVLRNVRSAMGSNSTKLTFPEFVDYLIKMEDVNQLGTHYRPMYALCAPCSIKYDFVGNFESLQADAAYILNKIGAKFDFPNFVPHATNSSAKKNILRYFSQLSVEQIKALYRVYENDFKLFGYSIPDYFKSLNGSSYT